MTTTPDIGIDLGKYKLGWADEEDYVFKPKRGLTEDIVQEMSWMKGEPDWMLQFRLKSLRNFERRPMPTWGGDMSGIDFDNIYYYIKPTEKQVDAWDELPDSVKNTYEKLGIPEAERKYLAGVTAQYESEVVYHRNREDLERQGVLFTDMDTALREHPEIVKKWFGKIIPQNDNKFAALNSRDVVGRQLHLRAAGRRGGDAAAGLLPHQRGEHGPVRADADHRRRGLAGALHRGLLGAGVHDRLAALRRRRDRRRADSARVTYTTIQNWSNNVYNLVTKRARVEAEGHMEWIDGNIGCRLTMKYPAVYMVGPKASGEVLSVAYAGDGQHQDAGAKMVHAAPETTSKIVSKSISKDGGRTSYRGLVHVEESAYGVKSHVQCDALILDEDSVSDTFPYMEVGARDAVIGHEATVSKVADEQLFYLMSRGLSEEQAMGMIVNGFIEPVTRTLPMEYAVEWSRLIELQMEGSVG